MKKQFLSVTLITALTFGAAGTYYRFSNAEFILQYIMSHPQTSKSLKGSMSTKSTRILNTSHKHLGLPVLIRSIKPSNSSKSNSNLMAIKPILKSSVFYLIQTQIRSSCSVDGFDREIQANHLTYSVNGDLSGEMVYAGLGTKEELEKRVLQGRSPLYKEATSLLQRKY